MGSIGNATGARTSTVLLVGLLMIVGMNGCRTDDEPTNAERDAKVREALANVMARRSRVIPPETEEPAESIGTTPAAGTPEAEDAVIWRREAQPPPEPPIPEGYSIIEELLAEAMEAGVITDPDQDFAFDLDEAPDQEQDPDQDEDQAREQDPDQAQELALNFEEGTDLGTIAGLILKPLGFDLMVDQGVTGNVTLQMQKLTPRGALRLLEQLLWMHGAYMTRRAEVVHILPLTQLQKERHLFTDREPPANVTAQIVPLTHLAPSEAAQIIQPYMTEGASTTPVPRLNSLILIEAPSNVAKIRNILAHVDRLGRNRLPLTALRSRYVDVESLAGELQSILPVLGFPISGDGTTPGITILPLPRPQVILVSAPTQDIITEIEHWHGLLDIAESSDQERVYFYEVRYGRAAELSEAIGTFFNVSHQTVGERSGGGGRGGTITPSPQTPGEAEPPSIRTPTATTSSRSTSTRGRQRDNDENLGRTPVFEVPVVVYVDGRHNRLVIRTAPRAYALLEALLVRLDSPPLQVLMQVDVAEIQLNKNTEFGFKYAYESAVRSDEIIANINPTGNAATTATSGLSVLYRDQTDPEDMLAFVRAIAGEGNTRVLFSPQIMAVSDTPATINVGDSVPVVTRESNTGDTTNITRDIQFRDTGIILTVTPHITNRKLVTLDIKQEVSDAVETTSSDIDSPTIQNRTVETSLLVENGTTVLLGGLITTRRVRNESGVPFVKDLPLFGRLAKEETFEDRRQELLILISVEVVELESDMENLVRRYHKAIQAIDEDIRQYQRDLSIEPTNE